MHILPGDIGKDCRGFAAESGARKPKFGDQRHAEAGRRALYCGTIVTRARRLCNIITA